MKRLLFSTFDFAEYGSKNANKFAPYKTAIDHGQTLKYEANEDGAVQLVEYHDPGRETRHRWALIQMYGKDRSIYDYDQSQEGISAYHCAVLQLLQHQHLYTAGPTNP